MDPRIIAINEHVKSIRNVIAVVSGKGGVGKSIISTIMALQLSKMGYKVGLLDTDFTSPSTHIILNAEELTPKEDKGVIPPEIHGLKYMTITYYTKDNPAPLRGIDVSNALIELLSITRWGKLDYLIIDAPPGISDIILDLLRINWRIKFIVVATPSKLALETVRKLIKLLEEQGGDIIGIIVNMVMGIEATEYISLGKRVLVEIPFQQNLEDKIGDVEELLESMIGRKVKEALKLIVEESP
ncbi:MAG: P-loop NTPase [archaeon YNP-LCB-024-027]|jgi:ATP-binding protein involved in chromosome partitioning|nr:P-loop NTPase [Candidatus Culexarchaeum yellowstonense]